MGLHTKSLSTLYPLTLLLKKFLYYYNWLKKYVYLTNMSIYIKDKHFVADIAM